MADESKKNDLLELAPETRLPTEDDEEQGGFWKKLKRGLLMTHTEIIDKVSDAMSNRVTLDDRTLEYLEEVLIGADLGVDTSLELVQRVKKNAPQGADDQRRQAAQAALRRGGGRSQRDAPGRARLRPRPDADPGGGRQRRRQDHLDRQARAAASAEGRAGDAGGRRHLPRRGHRAALWGERLGVEVIRQGQGADPGAVIYDAIHAAKARKIEQLIIDTAGRLHTKDHLMAELSKVRAVIDREAADWQKRTILVLDATTGQNALSQARTFSQVIPIDGVLLAKLDGTAKGGMVVAIARELKLPVLYLGVGEKAEDLVDFRPREFASALVG